MARRQQVIGAKQIRIRRIKLESLAGLLIFGLTLLIFLSSRVHQVTDSQYSMLLSQSLIDRGSFRLDQYAIPRHEPKWEGYYFANGPAYQLELSRGHLYYHLPPGSSVLSVPFVAALNLFGISAVNSDGTYNYRGEVMIEAMLAALLMALLASLFFYTARLMLPTKWSVLVALGGALGTQVYSTASRALWSHTWGILLLGIVILLLLRHEIGKRSLSPVLLASLLSWMYFVRPTFAVHIFAISIYLIIFHRRLFLRYAATGALWLTGFLLYSWSHFGQLLPSYYRAGRLEFDLFWVALAGNLISPSRGLLIYVPTVFLVIYLLVRYRRRLVCRRLVWLSLIIIAGHLVVISGFSNWWGGHSFGPRFTTDLIPWFVLLGILGLSAGLGWRDKRTTDSLVGWRVQLALGAALLLLSIFINTLGATLYETWLWNKQRDITERLWDWRQPQFLAGYLPIPPPEEFPPLETAGIDFTALEDERYLWQGWSAREQDARWSDGNHASIIFALTPARTSVLRIKMIPFLVPGKLDEQRVNVSLNDQPLLSLTLREPVYQVHSIILPGDLLQENNVLSFEISDAASPQELGVADDDRWLGIRVQWIEIEPQNQ